MSRFPPWPCPESCPVTNHSSECDRGQSPPGEAQTRRGLGTLDPSSVFKFLALHFLSKVTLHGKAIHPTHGHLLSAYYAPGTALESGNTFVNGTPGRLPRRSSGWTGAEMDGGKDPLSFPGREAGQLILEQWIKG